MLSRYQDKRIKITTTDGSEFIGICEAFPTGYGLHEFGRMEESILIDDVHIFLSEIENIEILSDNEPLVIDTYRFNSLMEKLLEGACWIVDILPEQVPGDARGQYFSVERYYLQPDRIMPLRRRFAGILLRLNCYFDMAVSFDNCETWEMNPDPETFTSRLAGLSGNSFFRAIFETQQAMIDIEPDDTYMTAYDPNKGILDKLQKLAASEGLFVWKSPES